METPMNEHNYKELIDAVVETHIAKSEQKTKIHVYMNIVTIIIAIFGVFASYAVFWKDSIETTQKIQNSLKTIKEVHLEYVKEKVNDIHKDVEDNEGSVDQLTRHVDVAVEQIKQLRSDLEKHENEH